MTDAEMVKAMEICKDKEIPCDDCPLVECGDCEGISRQYFYDRFKQLQSENAALRERLEKAIELPYEVGSTVYSICETDEEDKFNPWIDAGIVVSFSIDVNLWIYVRYNSGLTMWYTKDSFDKEVCITFEAAEARLAELKGEK